MNTEISIGLVCEGKTDFEIIKRTLGSALETLGLACKYQYLQPTKDATSGSYGEGGWRQVFLWCTKNSPERIRSFFKSEALFEGASEQLVDIILVQIDGDLCEILDASTCSDIGVQQVDDLGLDISILAQRRDYLTYVINTWLNKSNDNTEFTNNSIPIPTIMATEAWLLASCSDENNPNLCANPKQKVAEYWHRLNSKPIPDKIKKLKNPLEKYCWIFENSNVDLEKLNNKCLCFSAAKNDVLTAINSL